MSNRKKIGIFSGDWHFGRDSDSEKHNENLMDFVKFMVDHANKIGADFICQVGDYFDNRSKISVRTLNYGIEAAKYIAKNFDGTFYVITGNHDMFYKNRNDISSTRALSRYCHLIDTQQDMVIFGHKVIMTPWVCDGEHWDSLVSTVSKGDTYAVIGHFEFSGFAMNDNYVMEHGSSHKELSRAGRVITGHYHKRQQKDNVTYVGSPFPFDFNDVNDEERGFAVLDFDSDELSFVNWGKVKILSGTYEQIKEKVDCFDENTSVRIEVPENTTEEQFSEIEMFLNEAEVGSSKINFTGNREKEIMELDIVVEEVENIDKVIETSISSIKEPPVDVDVSILLELNKLATEYSNES